MDKPIRIRLALVADAANVHAILLSAKDDIPLRCPFETDHYKKWVRDQCRDKAVWIAEIGGKLAGVLVMADAEIFYLATVTQFRRRGVGRALIRNAIAATKRRLGSGVTVEVWEKNRPVIELLTSEGFLRHPEQPRKPHELVADVIPAWVVFYAGDLPKQFDW